MNLINAPYISHMQYFVDFENSMLTDILPGCNRGGTATILQSNSDRPLAGLGEKS